MYSTGREIKLIQQYTDFIQTYLLKESKDEKEIEVEYSDESDVSSNSNLIKKVEDTFHKHSWLDRIPMEICLHSCKMYYITAYEGQCKIKEINPKDDSKHLTVFESKSMYCTLFKKVDEFFYLMDDQKNIYKLEMQKGIHRLNEVYLIQIKDKDRAHFNYVPFENIIIND